MNKRNWLSILFCLFVATLFWWLPSPDGLDIKAWRLLGIFLATIIGLILKPIPLGVVTLLAIIASIVLGLISEKTALTGFSNTVVWLTVIAFFLSHGFTGTLLGKRLALIFVRLFGKSTLGLSYGLALSDLLMAPAIPSVTARSAGIIFPILKSLANQFESYPNSESSEKLGSFLTTTAFQVTVVTSAMFMTAMAANPLLASLLNGQSIYISWFDWALAAVLPGLLSLLVIPLVVYKVNPPRIKSTPGAVNNAAEALVEMGAFTLKEKIMLGTMVMVILLWVFGSLIGISTLTAALIGLMVLVIAQVISWKKLLSDDTAWHIFIWFGALLTLVGELNSLGLFIWFNDWSGQFLGGLNWKLGFPLLAIIYFFSHYCFASCTVHISVMFIPFFLLSQSIGTPTMLAAFILMFFSNLYGGLTHYSLTPAPLLFGAGYTSLARWWKVGFIVGLVNIGIWAFIGPIWWSLLGLTF